MSFNEDVKKIDNSPVLDITNLITKLCLMTGCDQEIAMVQLLNSDYDLQLAADKMLETMLIDKQIDNGWQTINRQKKFKKKETKKELGSNDDQINKLVPNRTIKSTNFDSRPKTFKNDERQNNMRFQNKRNRNIKAKNNVDFSNNNNYNNNNIEKTTSDADDLLDLNEELRWDNLGDIDGELKESRTNSIVDCFYSEDDFDFPEQFKNEAYQDSGLKLIADVNNMFNENINSENDSRNSDQHSTTITNTITTTSISNETVISHSNSTDSKAILECLMNQLPIFGKFSKTQHPKSLPIIPSKPVSFALPVKLYNKYGKFHYNFGIDLSELLIASTPTCSDSRIYTIPGNSSCKPLIVTQPEHRENLFNLSQFHNAMMGSNHPHFNNLIMHTPVSKQQPNVKEILHTIFKQKQDVAILFAQQQQAQPYYPLSKSINLVPMTNSNPMYSMQMNPDNHVLYKDIDNGLTHQNQDYFLKNLFSTTNNISVPFPLAKK